MKEIFSKLVMVMSIITLGITMSCQNPLLSDKTQGYEQEESRSTTAWRTGIYVPAGSFVTYGGKTYKVLISHTTHSGWVPGAAGTWSIFEEVSGQGPARPATTFELKDMTCAFHKVTGNTLTMTYSGQNDIKRTTLKLNGLNESISKGEKVVLKAYLNNAQDVNVSGSYETKIRGYIKLSNGREIYGAFQDINWSRGKTSNITIDVDNVNVNGTIKELGFQFPYVLRQIDFTNMSYQVTASGKTAANGAYGFPNRTTAFARHSAAIYLKSLGTSYSQEKVEADVQDLFVKWKNKYLRKANFKNLDGTGKIGKYVAYAGGVESMPSDDFVPITTSECHGWGMLILAHMDSATNNTKSDFDEMVDYYLQWKSDDHKNILDWQQSKPTKDQTFNQIKWVQDVNDKDNDGDKKEYIPSKGDPISVKKDYLMTTPTMYSESKVCYGGFGGAADGDFDMAYALLIADKQWGSSGKHNYKQIATDLIKAIKKYYVASAENSGHILLATHLQAGDSPDTDSDSYWATRSSDLLLTHYNAFKKFTGDAVWDTVTNRAKDTFLRLQLNSPKGLFCDYYVRENGVWVRPTGKVQEKETDGAYSWNSCRSPWRTFLSLSYDGLRSPFTPYRTTHQSAQRFNYFVKQQGGPKDLYKGYDADGTKLYGVQKSENMAFAAPAFLASMYTDYYTESEIKQNYAHILDDNNLRKYDVGLKEESKPFVAYYGESVRLINMIAYSGNWINP